MLPISIPPLPDELVYSLASRAARLNALWDTRAAIREIVGNPNAMVAVDLPGRLNSISTRLGLTCTARQLLDQHTLFPYYGAFMSDTRWEQAQQAAARSLSGHLKAHMGLLAHGLGASAQLRCCPQCDEQSRSEYGTAYWHRIHHLPAVQVCVVHRCALHPVAFQHELGHRSRLLLPPQSLVTTRPLAKPGRSSLRLADISVAALHSGRSLPSPACRHRAIQSALVGRGWTRRQGAPAFAPLGQQILADFGDLPLFTEGQRLTPRADGRMPWLEDLFSPCERYRAPLCHLLLIGALFETWNDFLTASASCASHTATDWQAPRRIGAAEQPLRVLPASPVLLDPGLSCRQAAQRAGLCTNTVVSRRKAEGIHVAVRPHHASLERLDEARKWLANGISVAQTAQHVDLSLSTLYRLLAGDPPLRDLHERNCHLAERSMHRDRWMALTTAHPTEGIKALRHREKATFAWLYRRDRDWLAAHRPPKQLTLPKIRVDWPARDARLAGLVVKALQEASSALTPLARPAGLVAHVYHPTPARKYAARLPRFWQAVSGHTT